MWHHFDVIVPYFPRLLVDVTLIGVRHERNIVLGVVPAGGAALNP